MNSILLEYSPDKQSYFASNKELCFKGNIPTLKELNKRYGEIAPVLWINPQLANLAMFCNISSLLNEHTVKEFSSVMVQSFGFLKLSEVMMFFHNCKSGTYGKIFSLMDITVALRQFLKRREDMLGQYESREEETHSAPISWDSIKDKFNINTKSNED